MKLALITGGTAFWAWMAIDIFCRIYRYAKSRNEKQPYE